MDWSRLADFPWVGFAYLFGSHVRGEARAESDVDLGVWLSPDAPQDAWWQLLRALDVDRLHLTVLNDAPPLFAHRVLAQGQLVYLHDPVARHRFQLATVREYCDMLPRQEAMISAMKARLKPSSTA